MNYSNKRNYLNYFAILNLKTNDMSLVRQNEIKKMLDFSQSKIYDTPYYRRQFFVTRTPNKIYER
jgi:hypothetical protein